MDANNVLNLAKQSYMQGVETMMKIVTNAVNAAGANFDTAHAPVLLKQIDEALKKAGNYVTQVQRELMNKHCFVYQWDSTGQLRMPIYGVVERNDNDGMDISCINDRYTLKIDFVDVPEELKNDPKQAMEWYKAQLIARRDGLRS